MAAASADEAPTAQLRPTAAPLPPAPERTAVAPPPAHGGRGRTGFVAGLIAVVLAFGAIGGGATYFLLLAPDDDAAPVEPSSLQVGDAPASADAASSTSVPDDAPDDSGSGDSGPDEGAAPAVLPDVSTHELEEDIAALLVDFHEAVVDQRFHDAWAMLSKRKQEQIEREDGFAAWSKAQGSLSPYLEPWGLEVSAVAVDPSQPVVRVLVTGMGWTKPGATCTEWSGLTWVRNELGVWKYDPGYSTIPEREARWKPRYEELLGAGC